MDGKAEPVIYHRGSYPGSVGILIGGILCSAIVYLLFRHNVAIFFLCLFFIGALSSFINSRRPIAKISREFLTIYWGFPGVVQQIEVEFYNIEDVRIITTDRKQNLGPFFFFARLEFPAEGLQIKLKFPPSGPAKFSLDLLRDSIFESNTFKVESNTEIWLMRPPKEGFSNLLSDIKSNME